MAIRHQVFVGIGSNLAYPETQVQLAVQRLARDIDQTTLVAVSSLYRSAPMGPQDQPDYINAVAELSTLLTPESLLDALQAIETEQGRVRTGEHWGPRVIDLDILLFGAFEICTPRLRVPHPGMRQRAFVLAPLDEVAPGLLLPDGSNVRDWLQRRDDSTLRRLPGAKIPD